MQKTQAKRGLRLPVCLTLLLTFVGLNVAPANVAPAAEIASRFDADAEAWTVTSGAALVYSATGGNPTGHLELTDTAAGVYAAVAPTTFHGDLSAFDGGTLSFDVSQIVDNAGTVIDAAGTLTVSGPAGSASVDLICAGVGPGWTRFEVPFDADTWGVPAATWSAILADVTNVDLVADLLNGTGDTLGLDNFVLSDAVLPSDCDVIDFEAIGRICAADDTPITTQFRHDCGVVFGIDSDDDGFVDPVLRPFLEAAGGAGDGPFGFNNNALGQTKDTADPGFESLLGSFLLRGEIPLAPVTLVILYDTPVAGASGEIWDIDGAASEGTEQWRVEAMGASYAAGIDPDDVVASVDSPIGTDLTLDGRPWIFSFSRPSADIHALRLTHIGTDTTGVGLAFNNFSPAQPASTVPVLAWPGLLATLGGIVGVGVTRLRAKLRRRA